MPGSAEIIRGLYEAFERNDVSAVLGTLAPHLEWTEAEGFPYGGTYTSPEAVLQNVFMKLATEWEGFEARARQFVAEGDTVVVLGTYSGTFNATKKRFSAPFAHVWTLEAGKVVRFQQYTDTAVVRQAMS